MMGFLETKGTVTKTKHAKANQAALEAIAEMQAQADLPGPEP